MWQVQRVCERNEVGAIYGMKTKQNKTTHNKSETG